ncbi:alpha/beta hydrolase [Streptococcus moroccensis]|uniref:Alpha-beta hydrolase superfamily lysophospholipase n=1 Tax=Streptococcus moroccensis TaxID=1451356 RepID=A0ABT9YRM3_9STRE|nr:alpha/beta hydrolase [Streptococcus moroccensis]MDQ0222644.1 alpha-beta hydrolase superfamily lysophospholipase [Streptococcus moroccensis]
MVPLKRKHQKRRLITFLVLAVPILLAGGWLRLKTYKADPSSQQAVSLAQQQTSSYYYFEPTVQHGHESSSPLIIYGGGLVETEAYAYLAASLAEQGSSVYLLKSPVNLPILNQNQALSIIEQKDLQKVYLIGHSLGGVAASTATSSNSEIDGLILLASYPSQKTDLSQSKLSVLSITAENDRVLDWGAYDQAKERLPQNTQYVTIPGGNHSGFGLYGQQEGDGQSTLTSLQQQEKLITIIKTFLETL